jgi:hypothetical protein
VVDVVASDVLDVEELDVCFVVDDVDVDEFPALVVAVVVPVAAPTAAVVVVPLDPEGGGSLYPFEPLEPADGLAPTLW